MHIHHADQALPRKELHFPNGKRAWFVTPPQGTQPQDILHALGIQQPEALVMLVGGADNLAEHLMAHLAELCSDGIAKAVVATDAMIIDGGTHAGVMAMMGQAVADHGSTSVLLGVVPAGLATYPGGSVKERPGETAPLDPNHSHFVLVQSDEWGGETDTMYTLARILAEGIPVVTLVVNGGGVAKNEVLYNVRYGWPLLVIEGSGRLADDIANLWRNKPSSIVDHIASLWRNKSSDIEDEKMREIITKGNISLFPITGSPTELMQQIMRLLGGNTP